MKLKLPTNWRTTAAGVLAIVVAVGSQFVDASSVNPKWLNLAVAVLTATGLIAAKDGDAPK